MDSKQHNNGYLNPWYTIGEPTTKDTTTYIINNTEESINKNLCQEKKRYRAESVIPDRVDKPQKIGPVQGKGAIYHYIGHIYIFQKPPTINILVLLIYTRSCGMSI